MQFVTPNGVTPWAFEVTPKQSGVHELTLALDAIITVDEKEGPKRVNTFTRKIVVEVGWPQTAGEWFEAGKKWVENVSYLWLTILVPVGGFIMARWRRKPSGAAPQPSPPASSEGLRNLHGTEPDSLSGCAAGPCLWHAPLDYTDRLR
jgi:hypothetical protein